MVFKSNMKHVKVPARFPQIFYTPNELGDS